MKITIKKEVFEKFHKDFRIAFLFCTNIDNKKRKQEAKHLLEDATRFLHLTFHKDTVKTHHLLSPWAILQEKHHNGKSHYHTSVERLLRKVIAQKSIVTNDSITNLVRYTSLKYLVPISVENPVAIDRSITYALSKGTERAHSFARVKKGSLFHTDKSKVLGTQLDYWQNSKTKMYSSSDSALIHIPTLPPVTKKQLNAIVKDLANDINAFCGGSVKILILDKKKNTGSV